MSAISNSSLTASLAAAGDQWSWCETLIAALGSSRTVEFKTFSAAPSSWETGWSGLGTTFYAAPLTGAMSIDEGAVSNLGVVGIPTVVANAVLSTGFAAMRISGGGNWRQATVGLAGATGYDGRPVDIGYDGRPVDIVLRKNPNGTYGIVLNSAKFAAPSTLPRTVDNELYRLTLVNDKAEAQEAGSVTQTFGAFFEQGEIESHAYPQFRTTGGQLCLSTQFSHVRWPDGSLRWCGVIMVLPQAVPAGGSIEIQVRSGGARPVASSRTLADASSLNLNVLLGGVVTLTGDWAADLNEAVATPSNVVKLADGPAGAIFRVKGKFKQSGADHGQLNCYHYVQVLQNAAGQHAGTRYLGRAGLPWRNTSLTPAAEGMTVTVALRQSTTVFRQVQGVSGSGTGNNTYLPHYGSVATCGANAMYDFFPAAQAAECVVRVRPAGKKAARARLVPPYDFSLVPTAHAVLNYVNHGNASMVYATGTTGERPEIALIPSWAAKYIIGDPENAERAVRVNAMATVAWCTGYRDVVTGEIVTTADTPTSYAGLGTKEPLSRFGYVGGGFALPLNNTKMWSQETDMHHRPSPVYAAYLFTAEPQYLDLLVEQSANFVSVLPQGQGMDWKTAEPISTDSFTGAFHSRDIPLNGSVYPGAGMLFRHDLPRYAAWAIRDMVQAGAIYPDACPYGTAVKQYMLDIVNSNINCFVAYRNLMSANYRNNGLLSLRNGVNTNEAPWCQGYLANVIAQCVSLLDTPNSKIFAQHMANYWISIKADPTLDYGAGMTYESSTFDTDGTRLNTVARQTFALTNQILSFNSTDNTISVGGTFGFANGDVIQMPDDTWLAGVPARGWAYVVNKSSRTFQLASSPGGAPLAVLTTKANAGFNFKARIANLAPDTSYEFIYSTQSYLANVNGAVNHLTAVGCTGTSAAMAEGNARVAARAFNFQAEPKNAFISTYPTEA